MESAEANLFSFDFPGGPSNKKNIPAPRTEVPAIQRNAGGPSSTSEMARESSVSPEPPRVQTWYNPFHTWNGLKSINVDYEPLRPLSSQTQMPNQPQTPNQTQTKQVQQPSVQTYRKRSRPVPPTSEVVAPFGGTKAARYKALAPIVDDALLADSPTDEVVPTPRIARQVTMEDLRNRPTCSLSLVCYSRGCSMTQIRVTKQSKYNFKYEYQGAVAEMPTLATTDKALFKAIRDKYSKEICGFWRRWFSLKTLKRLRLLSYTETTRPTPVPLDEFTMQEVLYAYNHPSEFGSETDWIDWVFRLRQPDKRHALEFVEGWDGTRIAVLGLIPCVASALIGVIWTARGGDAQTAFTVSSFILTMCTVLLALLAVISAIDSKAG